MFVSFVYRLFGLTGIVMTDCNKPWLIYFWPDVTWPMYASPAAVLILYFVLAWEIRRHCEKVITCKIYRGYYLKCHCRRSTDLLMNKLKNILQF